MQDGKRLWSIWQRLLAWFGPVFTSRGWVRFAQWVSGTVLCDEQHTITQEVTRLGLVGRWRALAQGAPREQRQNRSRGHYHQSREESRAHVVNLSPCRKAARWQLRQIMPDTQAARGTAV